jgi:hypothetical protein
MREKIHEVVWWYEIKNSRWTDSAGVMTWLFAQPEYKKPLKKAKSHPVEFVLFEREDHCIKRRQYLMQRVRLYAY